MRHIAIILNLLMLAGLLATSLTLFQPDTAAPDAAPSLVVTTGSMG